MRAYTRCAPTALHSVCYSTSIGSRCARVVRQVRWNVRHARAGWEGLGTEGGKATLEGVVTTIGGCARHASLRTHDGIAACPRSPRTLVPEISPHTRLRTQPVASIASLTSLTSPRGRRPVWRHMTVGEDMDVVALEGDIVKSLRF